LNGLAQAAAIAALTDRAHYSRVQAETRQLRAELVRTFSHAGYRTVPSQANFVLVLAPDEEALERRLAAGGVRVRPGRVLGVPGTLRVTVPDEAGLRFIQQALAVAQPVGRSASRH
jgi:histidinol-phosphate aminotransferase